MSKREVSIAMDPAQVCPPHSPNIKLASTRKAPAPRTIFYILGVALLVQLTAVFSFPNLHHPDELFQVYEQAHRLAFGYGIRTWEFEDGIRSLVIPYLVSKLFLATSLFSSQPVAYLFVSQLVLSVLSVVTVASVYRMGCRLSQLHGILVGIVSATWFEMVYFSYRPLTEAIASDFLLIALSISSYTEKLSQRRLLLVGFCVATALMIRFHLFFGILFLAVSVARYHFRERWFPLVLGGAPVLLVFGGADYLVWGSPFHSFYQAFLANVVQSKASTYGVEPDYWYIQKLYYLWAGASPLIVFLIAIRGRKSLSWIGVALSIIVSHSLIPHKEYKFIFPASAILLIVAALGSADLIGKLQAKMGEGIARYLTICGVAFWLLTSLSLAFAPGFSDNWFRSRQILESALWLHGQSDLCGLLIYDVGWASTGGYTYLHLNIPMYNPSLFREAARRNTGAFNYVILNRSSIEDFKPDFSAARCLGGGAPDDVCVIWRQGLCAHNPGMRPLLEQSRLGEVHAGK